jgi:hypothetical protein
LDVWRRRAIDLELATTKSRIKAAQKAEIDRAKKAAALKKLSDKKKDKERRAAEKEAAKKRKVAEKAFFKALKESNRWVRVAARIAPPWRPVAFPTFPAR